MFSIIFMVLIPRRRAECVTVFGHCFAGEHVLQKGQPSAFYFHVEGVSWVAFEEQEKAASVRQGGMA